MTDRQYVDARFDAIQQELRELKKLLISTNHVPAADRITSLAHKLATGDITSLKDHNKSRKQARRIL